jgi:deoxyribodipyrimidine photo-lyase
VDYDPASNNGGWQWIASTGTDSQPYFRIFNPWLQQGTYDPIGEYISKWVPELKDVAVEHLCKWYDPKIREIYPMANKMYGSPIVDYTEQKKKALKMYSEIPNST